MQQEVFGIASFRSRQQVLKFEGALRRAGVRVSVITTPRDVSVGCGLSIRFELNDARHVMEVYEQLHPSNLIGFYRVERENGQRTVTKAVVNGLPDGPRQEYACRGPAFFSRGCNLQGSRRF